MRAHNYKRTVTFNCSVYGNVRDHSALTKHNYNKLSPSLGKEFFMFPRIVVTSSSISYSLSLNMKSEQSQNAGNYLPNVT
jgi:hypothetical protein